MRLTGATRERVEVLFKESVSEVETLLERHCGTDLPLIHPEAADLIERIRFGVLKMSGGDMSRLRAAVELANEDWRDVLMEVGFDEPGSHKRWKPR